MSNLDVLHVQGDPVFDDTITGWEYHTHTPYASSTLKNNDEIRIPIHQQDVYTLPGESFLHVQGTLLDKQGAVKNNYKLVNNAVAFLFDEARYEIGGVEVDRVKNPGITSTVKNYLTLDVNDKTLSNAGWDSSNTGVVPVNETTGEFTICYPLKFLLPVFDDYQKIVLNVKQELVLLRANNDRDAVFLPAGTTADNFKLTLTKVHWKIPYVRVNDPTRLSLLKLVEADHAVRIPFRRWELHEYPALPQTKETSWPVKTSSQMETARYVIVAFQTDRKAVVTTNASLFDACDIRNVRLHLNSVYFPYDHNHGNMALFYDMYARFKSSYTCDTSNASPPLDFDSFVKHYPLYVIDCSKQNETLKSGSVDVRLDIEAGSAFKDKTTAYCIIVYDAVVEYRPLTGLVRRML